MFRRSSTHHIRDSDGDAARSRSRGPAKLSHTLSDLGDRVRRIHTSPSQPNLSSHRTSSSAIPPLPDIPTSPFARSSDLLPPISLAPASDSLSPPPQSLSQAKSMDTLPRTPTNQQQSSVMTTPPRSQLTPSTSLSQAKSLDTLVPPTLNPTASANSSPSRPRPTTRREIAARKAAEAAAAAAAAEAAAEAASSDILSADSHLVVSPPSDGQTTVDSSIKDLLHAMELDASSSTIGHNTPLSPPKAVPVTTGTASPRASTSLSPDSLSAPAFSRNHTVSAPSAYRSSSEQFSRFNSVPDTPPIPKIPARYQQTADRPAPTTSSSVAGNPLPNVAVIELAIAVIGTARSGKSEFTWKGMKVWNLSTTTYDEKYSGIDVVKRVAHPSAQTFSHGHSSSLSSSVITTTPGHTSGSASLDKSLANHALNRLLSENAEVDDDAASTLHERRRIASVTLYEVNSADLLRRRPATSGEGGTDTDWVWPSTFPHVDGFMVCYDVGDITSIVGLEEICGALQAREFPALAIECKTDLAHPEPTEANPTPKRTKDPSIVSADVMAVRMRRFAMGLVETSVRTESGKRAARAAFKWVIRSILRGQGAPRVAGTKWRNPASPDVLRALPWEFGDNDVFIPSTPSRGGSPAPPEAGRPMPDFSPSLAVPGRASTDTVTATVSQTMARSASSPGEDPRSILRNGGSGQHRIPSSVSMSPISPVSPSTPLSAEDAPKPLSAWQIAKPSTLPAVFVRDTPEWRASMAQGQAIHGVNGKPPTGSPVRSPVRGPTTASAVSPGGSGPSRAKSTPEFASSRVRFKVDKDAPATPSIPEAKHIHRHPSTSSKPGISGAPSSFPSPSKRNTVSGPPSRHASASSSTPRPRSTLKAGPPVLPPLNIPTTSSFAGAAEDIISSATASARIREEEEEQSIRERHASQINLHEPTSSQHPPEPQTLTESQSKKQRLRNMDSAALIEYVIAENAKKKNKHGNNPIFCTLDELLNRVVNSSFHGVQTTFIDTFLIMVRVYATPREVIEGLHRRLRVIEKKVPLVPSVQFMHFRVFTLLKRWLLEHPADFGSQPAQDEMARLFKWMKTKSYLSGYITELIPLVRDCAGLDDPDCMYAKVDPLAETWQEIDDRLQEEENDSDATETGESHTLSARRPSAVAAASLSRIAKGKERERGRFLPGASREAKRLAEARKAAELAKAIMRDSKRQAVAAVSPLEPAKDTVLMKSTRNERETRELISLKQAAAEEQDAAKRLRVDKYLLALARSSFTDIILFRGPKVFDYTPLVIGPDTTRSSLVQHLQRPSNILLMMTPRQVAEEMTNLMKPCYLNIQPRDWLRHTRKPKHAIIDDEPDYVPPRIPKWIPAHDDIDEINLFFDRCHFWVQSLILAPDEFAQRRKVVIHFIQIANELRRMDNYFISHAVQHGIRMTIHPGELLAQSVAKDPLYKVYQSLERLYEVADNHKKYRLALEMTTRPGIPDLSVHVVDFTKFETTPDFSVADKTKINWGRAMSICKQYLQIGALQKRFHVVNTHDYIDRPKVRRIIMETPTMPEIVLIERTSPIDYRDGAEHPKREAFKRVLGIKSVGPAYNPADTGPLPPQMRGILDREGRWS